MVAEEEKTMTRKAALHRAELNRGCSARFPEFKRCPDCRASKCKLEY